MKKATILWLILGGIALVAVGLLIGLFLPTPALGWHSMSMMRPFDGHFFGGYMPMTGFGLRWLILPLFCIGPIAGILALILVLARPHTAAPPAPPAPSAPPEPPKAE
jgi:hypothetical protein